MSAKTKNKCLFNDACLSDSRFSEWPKRTHNKQQAYCSFVKNVSISNMGLTSLTSHASRKKHSEIQISQSSNIGAAFFGKSNKDPASKESQKSQRTVESILVPVSTLRAEFF